MNEQIKLVKDRGDSPCFGIEGSKDGLRLIGIFNKNVAQFSPKEKLPWLLSASSHFSEMFPNKFPRETEFASLSHWEDSLINAVESESQFIWVGHVTWNGFREVFFHIDQPERVSTSLTKLAGEPNIRAFTFEIDLDEQWKKVSVYFKRKMRPPN